MVAPSYVELKEQLMEAGTELLYDPPSSVEELLPLLDRVLDRLAFVIQDPPDSMRNAVSPLAKALVTEKIFKHSDVDVKVAVAACIIDIMRISAPDEPYDDDQMKEVFQLIVSSFENLADKSSRSYAMRTQMLETMAKTNSWIVLVNLKCHILIIDMFQHFLNTARDNHPENVFSSMETIMTGVLKESDVIPLQLLSPITDHVEKDNEVPTMSCKLAEQVLRNSATKVIPYLTVEIKSLLLICRDVGNARDETVADLGHKEEVRIEQKGKQPSSVRGAELLEALNIEKGKKKMQARRKAIAEVSSSYNDRPSVSSPKLSKDAEQSLEAIPKTNARRMRNLGKEKLKASDDKVYGENLVGSRIKVWWPIDNVFYDGVIKAYDAAKKKHVVMYTDDGMQEILNLKRQKWEFLADESESSKEDAADFTSCVAASRTPQTKKARTEEQAKAKKGGGAASSKPEPPASTTHYGKKFGDE